MLVSSQGELVYATDDCKLKLYADPVRGLRWASHVTMCVLLCTNPYVIVTAGT